ncbi:MAG: hypothetical protein ACTFAK_12040 [Candidatus Electronema sp. VV]
MTSLGALRRHQFKSEFLAVGAAVIAISHGGHFITARLTINRCDNSVRRDAAGSKIAHQLDFLLFNQLACRWIVIFASDYEPFDADIFISQINSLMNRRGFKRQIKVFQTASICYRCRERACRAVVIPIIVLLGYTRFVFCQKTWCDIREILASCWRNDVKLTSCQVSMVP